MSERNESMDDLRVRAEKRLRETKRRPASAHTREDLQRLVHELEVHQIELEMQNEELQQARSELEAYLREYSELYDFAPVGYFTLDPYGLILRANLTGARLLGVERSRLLKQPFGRFVASESRSVFTSFLAGVFQDQSRKASSIGLQREGNGEIFVHIEARASENGRQCRVALVDITAQKQAEDKVRYQSFHDGLTGLHNRIYLEEEMERLDTERQLPIGIIMADLNALKLANDTYGHAVGDTMLKQTAEILRSSCRSEDIIARWGGDEFVIFLPQTTEEDAEAVCQRVDEKCRETHVRDIPLSLSVGAATKNSTKKDLEETLKEAEENMYRHKRAEGRQVKIAGIRAILKNLEAKSFETDAHYSTMQSVAHSIGKKIGLSRSELSKLRVLISLHDVGEIAISEEILTREGPLTAEEWEAIKKHPETGYRIVRTTEEFSHVAEDILSHHEHWDGSGYPREIKGKEIPLLARITAIADAYEVMSTGRAYKKAMSKSEVIAELRRCAGRQFDPELIEVFLLHIPR